MPENVTEGKRAPVPEDENGEDALALVAQRYAVRITPAVREAIGRAAGEAADPVALQYVPDAGELVRAADETDDPTGDSAHSPVPGIVHRYPDRVLLMPLQSCAVYCRYCFRREKVGKGGTLSAVALDAALDYIRGRPEIWEVILTGGDPLVLSPRRLRAVMAALDDAPHVRVVRIHSRVPVADPDRVTPELCAALKTAKALYVAVHVNHAREITPSAERALDRLRRDADAALLSQSVLLRGVNDSAAALEGLFRRLVELRVKPYYLHHLDKAPGTGRFRVGLREGLALVRALRGRVSGLCQPSYMLDIPGGHGKAPLGPAGLIETGENCYEVEDFNGKRHSYRS